MPIQEEQDQDAEEETPQFIDLPLSQGEPNLDNPAIWNPDVPIALVLDPIVPNDVAAVGDHLQVINNRLVVLERRATTIPEPTQWEMQNINNLQRSLEGMTESRMTIIQNDIKEQILASHADLTSQLFRNMEDLKTHVSRMVSENVLQQTQEFYHTRKQDMDRDTDTGLQSMISFFHKAEERYLLKLSTMNEDMERMFLPLEDRLRSYDTAIKAANPDIGLGGGGAVKTMVGYAKTSG